MKKLSLILLVTLFGCVSLNESASDVLVVSQNYDYEENSCENLGVITSTIWNWGTSQEQYNSARNRTSALGGNTFQTVSINEFTSQISGIALLCPRQN